jgi:hypothetical protein
MKFLDITTSTVLLATLLLDQALACVEVYGGASTGIGSVDVVLHLKDNDENICDVHVGNSQVMNCKQGYWAWVCTSHENLNHTLMVYVNLQYYWGKIKDPIQIQYITPHGNYNSLLLNKHCESHDCCSGECLSLPSLEVTGTC